MKSKIENAKHEQQIKTNSQNNRIWKIYKKKKTKKEIETTNSKSEVILKQYRQTNQSKKWQTKDAIGSELNPKTTPKYKNCKAEVGSGNTKLLTKTKSGSTQNINSSKRKPRTENRKHEKQIKTILKNHPNETNNQKSKKGKRNTHKPNENHMQINKKRKHSNNENGKRNSGNKPKLNPITIQSK